MALLEGALCSYGVPDFRPWRSHSLHTCKSSSFRICSSARSRLGDEDDSKPDASPPDKKFGIRVPSMPKLSDIESTRRALERAFQSFSFEIPTLPLESALRRIPIPKQIFIFDLGFGTTKVRKPAKIQGEEEDSLILDDAQYARCAWPRVSTEARMGQPSTVEITNEQKLEMFGPLMPNVQQGAIVYPHCKWPRDTLQRKESGFSQWPVAEVPPKQAAEEFNPVVHRYDQHDSVAGESLRFTKENDAPFYPRSSWPRRSVSGNGIRPSAIAGGGCTGSQLGPTSGSFANDRLASSTTQGVGRNASPTSSVLSASGTEENTKEQGVYHNGAGLHTTGGSDDDATALPRRMLATSVGLTIINQLARGGLTDNFLGSSLPAGWLDFAEDSEAASLDLGRRTLVVLFRG